MIMVKKYCKGASGILKKGANLLDFKQRYEN